MVSLCEFSFSFILLWLSYQIWARCNAGLSCVIHIKIILYMWDLIKLQTITELLRTHIFGFSCSVSTKKRFVQRNKFSHSILAMCYFQMGAWQQLSPHCPKMNKKFCPRDMESWHRSCGCKARETMVAKCELVLCDTSPVDLIHLIGPFKPYVAENISLLSSNCNILGLAATVALFDKEAWFTQI